MTIAAAPPAGAGLPEGLRVQTYEESLKFPIDMAWVEGTGKLFVTEKATGKIQVIVRGRLRPTPCRNLRVESNGESGALGIALDPDYAANHYLYVYYSTPRPQADNRVVRFTVQKNLCTEKQVIISGIPWGGRHNGGQLEFMDGYLFVSTGEISQPELAQDVDSLAGKILRLFPNGDIPADNPFESEGSPTPVWSYGHRNAFGLAVKPDSSQLYESENGQWCQDELNLIQPGANYGWGPDFPDDCKSLGDGENPVQPIQHWTPPIAPTDLTWYDGRLEPFDDSLLMGDYNTGKIRRFVLSADGQEVDSVHALYNGRAAIVDVHEGPGGWLYFLTPGAIKRIVEDPARR